MLRIRDSGRQIMQGMAGTLIIGKAQPCSDL
jgi:hypothetical protein